MKYILSVILLIFYSTAYADEYSCSQLSDDGKQARETSFSEWMPRSEYQSKFDGILKYGKYPIYVESNENGERRWILANRTDGASIAVKSGRTFKEFKEDDKVRKVRGLSLITTHCLDIDGTVFYSGVWVQNEFLNGEFKKLTQYGIQELN